DRCRVRDLDDRHAVARHELVGPADPAERDHLSGRPRLGTNLVTALREPPPMTTSAGSTPPSALVVVPTYNERDSLPLLIEGLMRHANVKVLVVDDQSPDGT